MENKRAHKTTKSLRLLLTCVVCLFTLWGGLQGPNSVIVHAATTKQSSVFLPITLNGTLAADMPAPSPWLGNLNVYRAMANLPPVLENKDWGDGSWLHSRYMVKNDVIEHDEDPQNEWYSREGELAAQASNLVGSSSTASSDNYAIESWMQAPFHALNILEPGLAEVGFGSFREGDGGLQMGAALDVIRGIGAIPASVQFPVIWPADGTTVPISSHWGEYPNPLSACPGYTGPSGLPVLLQIGAGDLTPNVTAHSFKLGKQNLEHCVFDETNYVNGDPSAEELGRSILDAHDAIVLVPRQPLVAGGEYTVSITANGGTYTWSFKVSSQASQLQAPMGEVTFLP